MLFEFYQHENEENRGGQYPGYRVGHEKHRQVVREEGVKDGVYPDDPRQTRTDERNDGRHERFSESAKREAGDLHKSAGEIGQTDNGKTEHSVIGYLGVSGREETDKRSAEYIHDRANCDAEDDDKYDVPDKHLFKTLVFLCSDVLTRKGHCGLTYGVHCNVGKAFYIRRRRATCYNGGAKRIYARIEN